MSDKLNPLTNPERAAHEVVLEMVRAGTLSNTPDVSNAFTLLMNHYRKEMKRIHQENTAQ
ncbi:hypothetical protein [Candidatus Symbiopectobacterium sp.]|uniref:hypothetical protein n=1 Tax=Candidatus Symbiopectobacterium sp. TaxID=2816440 RepID=UPI0025BA4509|nr:hypothetical protein [Candidatus Symbiopectobacterium sp.]